MGWIDFSREPSNHPDAWAKQMYDYCTTEPTLTGVALQNTMDGRKRITQLTTILHILDPLTRLPRGTTRSVSYASALYEAITNVRLSKVISSATPTNKQDMIDFLTEFFRQYFQSMLQGSQWDANIRATVKAEIDELLQEQGVNDVNAMVANMGTVIADTVDIFIRLKDEPFASILATWGKKYPKLGKFGRALTISFYALSLVNTIQNFLQWKTLKPQEKVQVITNLVDVMASMFSDIANYKAAATLASDTASVSDRLDAVEAIEDLAVDHPPLDTAPQLAEGFPNEVPEVDPEALMVQNGRAVAEDLSAGDDLATASSRWVGIAKVSDGFAKGFAIIGLGAALVCTGFQIQNDFDTGQSPAIKTLDILQEISTGVSFLAESGAGIAMLAGAEVCSAIPVIGIVAAVVGVIISLVVMFMPRKPDPSPAAIFVDNHCKAFLTTLQAPPQDWLDQQKKVDDHLKPTGTTHLFALAGATP